jgi:hypothetical protein
MRFKPDGKFYEKLIFENLNFPFVGKVSPAFLKFLPVILPVRNKALPYCGILLSYNKVRFKHEVLPVILPVKNHLFSFLRVKIIIQKTRQKFNY